MTRRAAYPRVVAQDPAPSLARQRRRRRRTRTRGTRQKRALPRCTGRYGAPWLIPWPTTPLSLGSLTTPFDAVISALTARAAYTRQVHKTSKADHGKAETEGWIAFPCAPLGKLLSSPTKPRALACRKGRPMLHRTRLVRGLRREDTESAPLSSTVLAIL